MPYKFEIDQKSGVVLFSATGVFTPVDFLYCISDVVDDPRFKPGFSHLVDLRAVKYFVVSPEVMRDRVVLDKDLSTRLGRGKIAIVSSSESVYGITKIYEALMKDSSNEVNTFMDIAEARQWLGLPDEADDT